MTELVGKRWFQVVGVIVLLVVFMVAMAWMKRSSKEAAPPSSGSVADVCGEPLLRLEYQAAINRRTIRIYQKERMVRASDRERIHIMAFRDLVNDKILKKEAEKLNITVTELEINKRIERMKNELDPLRRDMLFNMFLQSGGYRSEQDLREDIRVEILENKLTQRLYPPKKYKLTEKEIRDNIPYINVSQIFLPLTPDLPPGVSINDSFAKMEERANEIYARAAAGEDFNKLALKYSQDTAVAQTKGHLGWISRTQVVPEFWQVAASLSKGEISRPFQTKVGIHILKCEDRSDPGTIVYDDAMEVLRMALILRKQKQAFSSWFARKLATLQEQDCIKVYDAELLANKYRAMGKLDKAIEEYKKAIKEDKEYAYYYVNIAELLGQQAKKTEAMKWLRKATEISPMDGGLYFRIGEVYMTYGEPEKALREFRRASDLSRLDAEIHMRLQSIYSQLGLLQEVDEEHTRYLKAIEMRGGRKDTTAPEATEAPDQQLEMPSFDAPGSESAPPQGLPLREPGQP